MSVESRVLSNFVGELIDRAEELGLRGEFDEQTKTFSAYKKSGEFVCSFRVDAVRENQDGDAWQARSDVVVATSDSAGKVLH